MRPLFSRFFRLALFIPLLQLGARTAHAAEPEKDWKVLFDRCQKLTNEGAYEGGLEACKQAYVLNPVPGIVAYIAQIHTVLLHPVEALEAFERYLEFDNITSAERKNAEGQVRYLKTKIARLTITTPIEGAEIRVDDQIIDTSVLAKGMRVPAGIHRIELEAQSATHSRVVDLHGGESARLELPGNGLIVANCAVPDTRLFIDEREVSAAKAARGISQPAGRHRVTFKAGSTSSPEQVVTVTADESVTVVCSTMPHAGPIDSGSPKMNPRGYWVTGAGLALGAAALTAAIYNGSQYNRWETANDDLRNDLKNNAVSLVEAAQRAQDNDELMDSIKTGRKVAVGLGVAGALVTAGGILLLFADSKAPSAQGNNSWFRKAAGGVTVNAAMTSGEVAWRGAW